MAHISIDLPSITSSQKKKLITEMQKLLSEIAEIDVSEITVSLHELPLENMSSKPAVNTEVKKEQETKEKPKQEVKKKSFFKEMFP